MILGVCVGHGGGVVWEVLEKEFQRKKKGKKERKIKIIWLSQAHIKYYVPLLIFNHHCQFVSYQYIFLLFPRSTQ